MSPCILLGVSRAGAPQSRGAVRGGGGGALRAGWHRGAANRGGTGRDQGAAWSETHSAAGARAGMSLDASVPPHAKAPRARPGPVAPGPLPPTPPQAGARARRLPPPRPVMQRETRNLARSLPRCRVLAGSRHLARAQVT